MTSAVGWVSSTTVKLAVPPDSVVTSPLVGLTVTPGEAVAPKFLYSMSEY